MIDKKTFKICESVKLGLSTYYLALGKPQRLTKEDRELAAKVIPTLPEGFTKMSENYEFSIWRKKN